MTETIKLNGKTYQLVEEEIVPSEWQLFGGEKRYIQDSTVCKIIHSTNSKDEDFRHVLPTKELAEAMLALCQLLQLRNETWRRDGNRKPDWKNHKDKYTICCYGGDDVDCDNSLSDATRILIFRTKEIRDKFLEKHRELIEQAKELI